ncbi:hypothetical protein DM01DRAFT_278679 [Hesseltinella vesiculosa]|uniref:Major facilitator superfamily (MFS) profile domain-containing protein n=1 Tax=Hesseltinella vesiculosa TaxID=101127 RepID=A0A1X2GTS8_9FUNG|nr:hypothetical protein DM01DRAFT_278679 [Hesseltinella vesiculosa]
MPLLTSQARIYLICSFVSLGGFIYRFDNSIIEAYVAAPEFTRNYHLDPDSGAGIAAVSVTLGAGFLASFMSGFVADRLGRKFLFYVAGILNVVGSIIQCTAPNLAAFLCGRVITGLGLGTFSMLVPLYQSEIARPENRGRLITLYQVGVTLGILVGFWIYYGVMMTNPFATWKTLLALQLVPSGILILGLHLIPESPRWLIYRNRYNEALRIMALLRSEGDKDDLDLQMEFTGVRQDVWFDKHYTQKSFMGLWSAGIENNRIRTLLGMGIHVGTQISGSNVFIFYLPDIASASGIVDHGKALFFGSGITGIIGFLGTFPCFLFIDRWPRRRVLVFGALAMAVCMLLIGILSGLYDGDLRSSTLHLMADSAFEFMSSNNIKATYAQYALVCVYLCCFALSWGPTGWIYPAEIYPQMIRANAMGVTTATSYASNLLMTLVAPFMFTSMKFGVYLFFGCMCLLMALVVHVFYPETKGQSLEEVNLIFSGALIDQRPGAHHPATAAEALLRLEQAQFREKRDRLERQLHDHEHDLADAPTTSPGVISPISTVVRSLESNILLSSMNPMDDLEKTAKHNSSATNSSNDSSSPSSPTFIGIRRPSLNLLRPMQGRRPSIMARRSTTTHDQQPSPPLPTTLESDDVLPSPVSSTSSGHPIPFTFNDDISPTHPAT